MTSKRTTGVREDLHRGLKERHIQLIAIGGAIGVGLFLGSNAAIRAAGPAIMLSYLIGGVILYIIMRALGEVTVDCPTSGAFSAHAAMFISPRAGFIVGWTYWFMWIVIGMAEFTAVGVYCNFWWPQLPQWIPPLVSLASVTSVNLLTVKLFGELEFWFALIKVVTILAMILFGVIFFINGSTGVSNLYALEGGFMPKGFGGVLSALSTVMFAFIGMELIGVAAGEAASPEKSIPNAIKKVLWRILIFYVGALFVIMSIFPWNKIGTNGSPFVLVFEGLGVSSAASLINFVVLTAALSCCNSGIFSTGRMMYALALQGNAPRIFAKVSRRKIPKRAILLSTALLTIGVLLNYCIPEKAFAVVTSIATFAAIWVWGTILIVQMRFRKSKTPEEIAKLKFPTIWYPIGNWIALLFLGLVCAILAYHPDTIVSMIVGPLWIAIISIAYTIKERRSKKNESVQTHN
ncbi:MAG: amino acid permease [Holosporaceae bacterium]|jgi:AAT family amino acid transporter|nr:amino acid permease [Holosporaceae bacterium]